MNTKPLPASATTTNATHAPTSTKKQTPKNILLIAKRDGLFAARQAAKSAGWVLFDVDAGPGTRVQVMGKRHQVLADGMHVQHYQDFTTAKTNPAA